MTRKAAAETAPKKVKKAAPKQVAKKVAKRAPKKKNAKTGGNPKQKPLVTITGVTGYLGAHVCLMFLQDGGYRVRGTVRDKNNDFKIGPIKKSFGKLFNKLELVEADLLDEASIKRSIEGATYVIHVASPFYFDNETEEELVKPQVEGTKAVMKACRAHGVKRCVYTSGSSALAFGYSEHDPDRPEVFDERHWSKLETPDLKAYFKGKTLAEKLAWAY